MWLRVLLGAATTFLLAVQVVRNSAVQEAEQSSALASSLWPGHPDVLKAEGMAAVGTAAASGSVPSQATMKQFRRLAAAAPYAPEPYLVEAAMAAEQGETARAERLLQSALERDPRSRAGHYLLADLYLRSGQLAKGLVEMARLTRVMPASSTLFVGALQQFARSGGTAAQLRQVFAANPALELPALNLLAKDPANAQLVVAAASARAPSDGAYPKWQETLLDSMVAAGEYQEAHQLWLRLVGASGSEAGQVFNPGYGSTSEPPPFNWTFASDSSGEAEAENGTLHVFHYGTNDAVLAKQLLLLGPGSYSLGMNIDGELPTENQLIWSLTCLPSRGQALSVAVPGKGGPLQARFEIPQNGCVAQELELQGRAEEPAQTADVHIGPIQIVRAK